MKSVETCARCGHETRGCSKCKVYHAILGGQIDGKRYCHTFAHGRPTCYEFESSRGVTGNASWY